MGAPVIVVGGGLAGLAAAARLAKAGRAVTLYERRPVLGGTWAPYAYGGTVVDDAPAVLGFPAPWRDLFRKCGRSLEAELARSGHALVPAASVRYVFADGAELVLPSDRGAQYATLQAAYGPAVAAAWRDLLDGLDDVWQALRPLGLEAELPDGARRDRATRSRLLARRTLAQLAATAPHPHLEAVIRSLAAGQGSTPEQAPAMVAVELAVERTFGRWTVVGEGEGEGEGGGVGETEGSGRSSVLTEALVGRLALRGVEIHTGVEVTGLLLAKDQVLGVRSGDGEQQAAAVVCTVDPWEFARLLPAGSSRRGEVRRAARLRPAGAPQIRHTLLDEPCGGVTETIRLTADGRPCTTYARPVGRQTLQTVHDRSGALTTSPAYGVQWQGFRSWSRRPAVTTPIDGLFRAGPGSPAGAGASRELLSGALAAYGCHESLRPV